MARRTITLAIAAFRLEGDIVVDACPPASLAVVGPGRGQIQPPVDQGPAAGRRIAEGQYLEIRDIPRRYEQTSQPDQHLQQVLRHKRWMQSASSPSSASPAL
jgi:hypothetical protein